MQPTLTTPDLQAALGQQVRALRLAANLSQGELARQAGVALGALKSLESDGSATLRTLTSVALCLGRREWLLGLQPAQTITPARLRAGKPRQPALASNATPGSLASPREGGTTQSVAR